MEIEKVLEKRKSCRSYVDREIQDNLISKIIWAAERAPFASGGPRRKMYVISDQKNKNRIFKACKKQIYVKQCSSIIIFCGKDIETKLRSGHPKYVHDCDAAVMCSILMATSLGVDSCWIGNFEPDAIKKILNVEYRPTVVLLLGYGDENK